MNENYCEIDFLVFDESISISKMDDFIRKFNIKINRYIVNTTDEAKNIIKKVNFDYILIPDSSDLKKQLDKIVDYLHKNSRKDCLIVVQDSSKKSYQELGWGNILIVKELTFDLFKRLINYAIINNNNLVRNSNEVKEIYQQNFIATHDSLTLLPNRAYALNKIEQSIIDARINPRLMALFFLDLDGFKAINDKAGHKTGDLVLQEIARRLSRNVRMSDIISRHGGDEFIVFLPQIRSRNDAEIVANKLLDTIAAPIQINSEVWNVSASIGVSMYPDDGSEAGKLIEQADAAMYMAKQDGKNTIKYFNHELRAELEKKFEVIKDIRKAITNNEFDFDLQPQHDLQSGEIIGVELFVRWNSPERGMVFPSEFLPYILNTGYINSLGNLILQKALALYYELNRVNIKNINIAMNVEARQFVNDNLIERIAGLKRYGINTNSLTIEITEDCYRTNFETVKERLYKLRELGVKICLDDFGLGNSSIAQLFQLPIDIIKIDNKLLSGTNEKNVKQSLIAMAHGLNIKVMAKRIEDENELANLRDLDCDYGQGFCYEEAMPLDKFVRYAAVKTKLI